MTRERMPPKVEAALAAYKAVRRVARMCAQSITCPRRAVEGKSRCAKHRRDVRRYNEYATRSL